MAKNLSLQRAQDLYFDVIANLTKAPVSFTYEGKQINCFGELTLISQKDFQSETHIQNVYKLSLDQNVEITYECKYCKEFGQSEYVVWIENVGTSTSKTIADFNSICLDFYGEQPVLRGILGDHVNYYAPYKKNLSNHDVQFVSSGGRATHINFPYFNLVHGNGGTLIALGWAGTWSATFSATNNGARLVANNCNQLNTVLLPGEKIRSALVVFLPYDGRDEFSATNLWREWFMKYNLPKANRRGDPLLPFTSASFANDTGLPNSDGSISERHFTWKRTYEKLLKEKLVPDFRWFDAGWYFSPSNQTVEHDWWGTVGTWELDKIKWPDRSFRESVDYGHEHGVKTLVWFEPERVTYIDDLIANYGYKDEWAVCTAGNRERGPISNNLGDKDCLDWTYDRITSMMKENDVDFFREDNNSDPEAAWKILNEQEYNRVGLPRFGISENKMICGHYELWDRIIEFCSRNDKCTFIDSCASGGGRNDIESLRRGFPLMRSDHDRISTGIRLSQTHSFCKWIPFHGSSIKETATELEASTGKGSSPYVFRASYLPVMNANETWTHNESLNYDLLRKNFEEWHSVKHLLTKDFYPLTPWHQEDDLTGWTAFAYDDQSIGESLLLAFRQENCLDSSFTATLPFVDECAEYKLENVDTNETSVVFGKDLSRGIHIVLDQPKSCTMIKIFKL